MPEKRTAEKQTETPKSSYLIKIKEIIINAFLLLIPSVIFIGVKANTLSQSIEWRPKNILMFFIFYIVMLSFFSFQPYTYIKKTLAFKNITGKITFVQDQIKQRIYVSYGIVFIIGLWLILYPFLFSMYQTKIFLTVFIFLIFAMGLNYTTGFTGILNLGHVLPFATGAYTYGILFKFFSFSFLPGLILGCIAGLLMAGLVALITIRLNGDYLAIVTLALAEIFRILSNNLDSITNGARGIKKIPLPSIIGIAQNLRTGNVILYYIALLLVVFTIFISQRLIASRFGRSWEAVREDDIASESSGINVKKVRVIVFAIGGAFAGIAGVLYASSASYINPSVSAIAHSITVLSIVVLGGMGSIRGVVLGTIIVVLLPEYLRSFSEYRMLVYGAMLVIMMRYRQRGMFPQKRSDYNKYLKEEKDDA